MSGGSVDASRPGGWRVEEYQGDHRTALVSDARGMKMRERDSRPGLAIGWSSRSPTSTLDVTRSYAASSGLVVLEPMLDGQRA